jgi:PhnB protein
MPQPMPTPTGVTPYLTVSDANAASAFYQRAFGAEEVDRRYAQDGKRMLHCHLRINGGSFMMNDPFPEFGHGLKAHQGTVLHIQNDDIQGWWQRAVEAGAEILMPLGVAFWGDRYGQLRDPFGVTWSLGGPNR